MQSIHSQKLDFLVSILSFIPQAKIINYSWKTKLSNDICFHVWDVREAAASVPPEEKGSGIVVMTVFFQCISNAFKLSIYSKCVFTYQQTTFFTLALLLHCFYVIILKIFVNTYYYYFFFLFFFLEVLILFQNDHQHHSNKVTGRIALVYIQSNFRFSVYRDSLVLVEYLTLSLL